ncbi:MAG TPA: 2-oxo-4-hydroxy-4-carboxy-5-ureidoimidazoline decarboxylase [Thermoanaerobaculia bacterium]|nr:2-oxo-4-hydroxy-4-carboxy-5-ureidoimidazoline decarboxylase [Thermoanaerobaculia bacterium]
MNALPAEGAEAVLLECCGSAEWARRMAARRPFGSEAAALDAGDRIWKSLFPVDWLEAFRAHPRIGDFSVRGQTAAEQAGARNAPEAVQDALGEANLAYEERFGYIFIVCASAKSAEEMLDLCRRRLDNDPVAELAVSAEEQRKITRLRMEKLFAS